MKLPVGTSSGAEIHITDCCSRLLCYVQNVSCDDVPVRVSGRFTLPAEKDEEGAKMLELVKVVTAKTGSTVDFSE